MATRHIAIVGSSTADVEAYSQYILDEMTRYLPDVEFHIRVNGRDEATSGVEAFVARVSEMWGKTNYLYSPEKSVTRTKGTTEPRSQRHKNFLRDIVLLDAVDEVVAFFDPERVMEGGTGHVVEVAIRIDKPCRAYTLRNGRLEEVGGWT